MFYAKNGDEITREQWASLFEDDSYKRVAVTHFESGRWVSTIWLGMDHSFRPGGDEGILIFETMVFNGDGTMIDEYMERYSTEEQARAGHKRIEEMVQLLQEVKAPDLEEETQEGESCPTSEKR